MKCLLQTILALALAAALAACDHGDSNDETSAAKPLIAAFNAVQDMGSITFLREEEVWTTLEFGSATSFRSVDADQYDLNFDTILPTDKALSCAGQDGDNIKDDDECTRLTSQSVNVIADHEYIVVLLGRYGDLRVQVYDKLAHEFDTSTSDGDPDDENTEIQFFHWSDDLPAMDIYLERPGANLSPVQSRATLASGGEFHAVIDKGDYVMTLAPVADPAHPYFTSESFALQEQTRVGFAILGGAGEGTSTIKVVRFRDQAGVLVDRRVKTELRVVHVAPDQGTLDVFAEGDFTQPFIASLAEGSMSPYVVVPSASVTDLDLDITPAGNTGVLLGHEDLDLVRGERATFALFETSGHLDGLRLSDPFRRIATHARLRALNTADVSLDFFIVLSGSNINTLSPTTQLGTTSTSGLMRFAPDRYDVILTRAGTDEVVYGPHTVDLAGGGIYTVIATGNATSVDAVLLDDFAN
jgi:uncharacterized protein DUF4397